MALTPHSLYYRVLVHKNDDVEITKLRYENSVVHLDRTVHFFSTVEWLQDKTRTFVTESDLNGLIFTFIGLQDFISQFAKAPDRAEGPDTQASD